MKAFAGERLELRDGLPIAFLLAFLLFYSIIPFFYGGRDLWRHTGVVASFAQNLANPEHETLSGARSEREIHSPAHFAIALLSRTVHLEPLLALRLSGLVSLVLFIAALLLVCRFYLRNAAEAPRASAITIFLMLFGHWASIGWSGETTFANLPYIIPQPSFLALALLLLALPLFENILDQPRIGKMAVFALSCSFVLLAHPPTGLCLLLQMGVQTAARRITVRAARTTGTILAVALVLTFAWPYMNLWRWIHLGGTREYFEAPVFQGALEQLGPAILTALPGLIWLLMKKEVNTLIACAIAAMTAFGLGLGFQIQSLARFMFYSSIYLNILTAVFLVQVFRIRPLAKFDRIAAGLVIFLSLGVAAASSENRQAIPAAFRALAHGVRTRTGYDAVISNHMAMLQHGLHPGDTVLLSSLHSGETDRIAAFTGAKFVFSRYAQANSRYEERRADAALFFSTTDAAIQQAIVDKYGVTALIILRADLNDYPRVEALTRSLGRPTDENRFYLLYRLAPQSG